MVDQKIEDRQQGYDAKTGTTITWDARGHCFVAMPVNGIPKKQFDDWIKRCTLEYSGKRWDMIYADRLKAQAYDALLMTIPEQNEIPEEAKDSNPDGLLNGGNGGQD